MATSAIKLPLVLPVCIAMLASSVTARPGTVAAATPTSEDFSLFSCISFVPKATKCVIDVLKDAQLLLILHVVKPSLKVHDCSSKFLKDISSGDMTLVKSICASWGVSIS